MAGPYKIELTRAAERDLKSLAKRPPEPGVLKRIDEAILSLRDEPRPVVSIRLQGSEFRRITVSDYRIVYDVVDGPAVVTVVRVRHRREVYRDE